MYIVIETVRNIVSAVLDMLGITGGMLSRCYQNHQVIRVINYHRTPENELKNFEKHLIWYKDHFQNMNKEDFIMFMNHELPLEKPGIILSFDDGLLNNYENAAPLLEKYGFTGLFFVSSGLADGTEYMTYEHMKDLLKRGHVIGCHTYTHHRMDESDSDETLNHEISEAGMKLEQELGSPVDIFCWCGGEENTYTRNAAALIRKYYQWGFMTNNDLIVPETDHYQLQRTNVEARWPLSTAKLQISGFMDYLYRKKRERVNKKTGG